MKKLIILLIESTLIIGIVIGIYITNRAKKVSYPYCYNKPLIRTRLDLSEQLLKKELVFFLAKELGLYGGSFEILDVVYLYTNDIIGAEYILVTLKAPDGRLCQITVSRKFVPWAKWKFNSKDFSIIEPLRSLLESQFEFPKWMQDLGVTAEQLQNYYEKHPEVAAQGESAFFDKKTGRYSLPSDWYQTLFVLVEEKGKTMRLMPQIQEEVKADIVNSYWRPDYPTEYLGLGYREYLYKKIEESKE